MVEHKRNIMVGVFALVGLISLGWMIFIFGDLPALVSRYDAYVVDIYFPTAPGIKTNSEVLFRGYPVGKVIGVQAPLLLPDPEDKERSYYQIVVSAAIHAEHIIPRNARAKVYRRGLGGSYVEFVLPEGMAASTHPLKDGNQIKGELSQGNEFLSEATQVKLDELIISLTSLSRNLEGQLNRVTPEQVDQSDGTKEVYPNVTTAVMRLDRVLKNLNQIIGDARNQENLQTSLENLAGLSAELREAVAKAQVLTDKAMVMVDRGTDTIGQIDETTKKFYDSFYASSARIQGAADAIAQAFGQLNTMLEKAQQGQGTMASILNDPRMYESMTDAAERLNLALEDFRKLVQQWTENGMKVKMK